MNLRKVDSSGHELEAGAADAYAALLAQARLDGIAPPSLHILSAYRSEAQQDVLWKKALEKYGKASVARIHVAPPGHSDHEKGIAVDLSGPDGGSFLASSDEAWGWMNRRAAEFGFRPYEPEPWHWAFKGSWSGAVRSIPGWAKWGAGGAAIALAILWPQGDTI